MAVFIVSFVTAWNDWKKEEQFIKLSEFNDAQNVVTVLRKGREEVINVDKLMVGDVVQIEAGMDIPVDAILLHGSGVAVDEAAMTGESDELKKEPLESVQERIQEHMQDEETSGQQERDAHSVPSPVLLSGT